MNESRAKQVVEYTFPELPAGSRVAMQRLDNGLQVLAAEVPTARQIRLVGAVGVGYLDEPQALPGLAHLLEHALFLGSRTDPRPGEFAAWVGDQGGRYNARTDEHVTDVHVTLPPAAARAGLTRLLNVMTQPCLDEATIANEVNVLDAEFSARLADPAFHRKAALSRFFLPSHAAYTCHAGNRASLDAGPQALRQQLAAFHGAHYRSERMSLVMLGPMALDEQLSMLHVAGRDVPSGAHSSAAAPGSWRWGRPAHLQWCLPEALPNRAPTLELLWPLPLEMAERYKGPLSQVASMLCDGSLAQTLLDEKVIEDMAVSLTAETIGNGLFLTLTLSDAGRREVDQVITTCQAAVQERLARISSGSWQCSVSRIKPAQLNQWTLDQARRLAQQLPPNNGAERWAPNDIDAISHWLVPAECRVLEEVGSLESACHVPETRTRFREVQSASSPESSSCTTRLHLREAPVIVAQPPVADDAQPLPGLLETRPLALWWGGGTNQKEASWCLGWAASLFEQRKRLRQWHQESLAVRHAAWGHGVAVMLGGDSLGDWLVARGPAAYLESVITQLCATWPVDQEPTSGRGVEPDSSGLLAQRLLAKLETAPVLAGSKTLPRKQTLQTPSRLSWANGELSATQAVEGCRRLACLLPAWAEAPATHEYNPKMDSSPIRWLPPQAEDYALMLQIDAADASPRSRLLMKLLEWCHDAAFFRELRQQRGLGYVAAVRYREMNGWPRLGYVVQSPHIGIEELQQAITEFMDCQAVALALMEADTMAHRRGSLRAIWGPPETMDEAILACWHALRVSMPEGLTPFFTKTDNTVFRLAPWERMDAALEDITPECVSSFAETVAHRELTWTWWAHAPQPQ